LRSSSSPTYGEYLIPKGLIDDVTPQPIDEKTTSDTLEAFYDSRAVAYRGLATALGTSDVTAWANEICESLRSAINGHEVAEGEPILLPLTNELADQTILKQREYIDRLEQVVDLDALAREDKNLLTQAGKDQSCALQ
jgi:hypothetical protein